MYAGRACTRSTHRVIRAGASGTRTAIASIGNSIWTSAADVQMLFPMEAIAARLPDAPARITQWVERVHARPAYKRALERGGPYEVAV